MTSNRMISLVASQISRCIGSELAGTALLVRSCSSTHRGVDQASQYTTQALHQTALFQNQSSQLSQPAPCGDGLPASLSEPPNGQGQHQLVAPLQLLPAGSKRMGHASRQDSLQMLGTTIISTSLTAASTSGTQWSGPYNSLHKQGTQCDGSSHSIKTSGNRMQPISWHSSSSQGMLAALTSLGSMRGVSLFGTESNSPVAAPVQGLASQGGLFAPVSQPSTPMLNPISEPILRVLDQWTPSPSSLDVPSSQPSLPAVDPGAPNAVEEPSVGGEEEEGALQCSRGNTYQPSKRKRVNKHGLRQRLSTPKSRAMLMNRIKHKRWRLTVDQFVI